MKAFSFSIALTLLSLVTACRQHTIGDRVLEFYNLGKQSLAEHDAPQADIWFRSAIETGDASVDPQLIGEILVQRATLLYECGLYDQALTAAYEAINHLNTSTDNRLLTEAYRAAGRSLYATEQPDCASSLFHQASDIALRQGDTIRWIDLQSEWAARSYDNDDPSQALRLLENLAPYHPDLYTYYCAQGDISLDRAAYDSAYLAFSRLYDCPNLYFRQYGFARMAEAQYKLGKLETAYRLLLYAFDLKDSLYAEQKSADIVKINSLYDYNAQQKLREESQRNSRNLLLTATGLLLVLLVGILYLRYRYRCRMADKERQIQNARLLLDKVRATHREKQEIERLRTEQSATLNFRGTPLYQRFERSATDGSALSKQDWQALSEAINDTSPDFLLKLRGLARLSEMELYISILVKLNFTASQIASILHRSPSAISVARRRLFEKATGKEGSAGDWDKIIERL